MINFSVASSVIAGAALLVGPAAAGLIPAVGGILKAAELGAAVTGGVSLATSAYQWGSSLLEKHGDRLTKK